MSLWRSQSNFLTRHWFIVTLKIHYQRSETMKILSLGILGFPDFFSRVDEKTIINYNAYIGLILSFYTYSFSWDGSRSSFSSNDSHSLSSCQRSLSSVRCGTRHPKSCKNKNDLYHTGNSISIPHTPHTYM